MALKTLRDIVKDIYESGVRDFEEIDTNWDPSDRQEGIDETFEEYWENSKAELVKMVNNLGEL